MFERRLKVFLFVLAITTAVLIGRSVQLQMMEHAYWASQAVELRHHDSLTATTRGRLLDVRGRPLAENAYCFDACVDYRAIESIPDPRWLHEIALQRIKARDVGHRDKSISMDQQIKNEIEVVNTDIDRMWDRLAHYGGMTSEQMDDLRESIEGDVEMRHDSAGNLRQRRAKRTANATTSPTTTQSSTVDSAEPWYRKWLFGDGSGDSDDKFTIQEETQPHVILRSITPEVYNALGKEQEHFPGLSLQPGMERRYPYGEAGCHVLGAMDHVNENDLTADPNRVDDDLRKANSEPAREKELHAYQRSDLIGRGGLEQLCEPLLRGTRGRIQDWGGDETGEASTAKETILEAAPGEDVRTTIDIDLEKAIRATFYHVNVKRHPTDPDIFADMHGAAVVIDIASGEVRAMVSAPGFDPNTLDRTRALLDQDEMNKPMFNRATRDMFETGSTIKPLVGIGAISQGVMKVTDTIECTGFLMVNGNKIAGGARCWTLSEHPELPDNLTKHHQIPTQDPHPSGFLTFTDALQRSCNVFFQNMGYRLGVQGLSYWMRTFGLGRPTGVGVFEVPGLLPDTFVSSKPASNQTLIACLAGMGQGSVAATPIQMANVAATIARNGWWMRPRLVSDEVNRQLRKVISAQHPSTQPSWIDLPDQAVDLKLAPDAVSAAQEGMFRVVNTLAGTGSELFQEDLQISGKTGTAQAAPFSIILKDKSGQPIIENSKPKRFYPEPSTPDKPNPLASWYLGFPENVGSTMNPVMKIELKHSWYIGYAPSHHPKIAFAVLVEYGGSGGKAAGTIAKQIIDACVKQGYLQLDTERRQLVLTKDL